MQAVDAALQAEAKITCIADLKKINKGGGGTDMTIGGRQTFRFQVIFDDATLDKIAGHGGNITCD